MHQLSQQLANVYQAACIAELEALKPGNVHIFADGHGMTVQDFMLSAQVSAQVISQPDLSLGQRILQSVQATHNAVGTNTNLGIILLCAPLIQTCFECFKKELAYFDALQPTKNKTNGHASSRACLFSPAVLQAALHNTLNSTSVQDANDVFAAIRLANPAGLGASAAHDVQLPADCNLLQAMQFAADKDLIAKQYANNFEAIFMLGVPQLEADAQKEYNSAWSTTKLYLTFLATFLDSHIVRKYGKNQAIVVQNEAKQHLTIFNKLARPKDYVKALLEWDNRLKQEHLNPGTSADLTVACLFAVLLTDIK